MKMMARRLRLLENKVSKHEIVGPSWADVLRERRRRRLGSAYKEPPPPDPVLYANGRQPTWAEVLRSARARRCTEARSRPAEQRN
jgi:hypothetical protein